jgi:hypothetical protein
MKVHLLKTPGELMMIGAVLLRIDAAYGLVTKYRALNATVYKRNPIL